MSEEKKYISRRSFLKAASLSAAGIVLVACSPKATPEAAVEEKDTGADEATKAPVETKPEEAAEPVALTFWTWQTHDEQVAAEFMEKNPNITIETTVAGPWDLQDKLIAAIAAGSGAPEVDRVVMRMFYRFSGPGKGMLDITDRVKDYLGDAPQWAWGLLTVDDRVYGMPSENNLCGLYYRTDIFEKYGIDVPETWEEFVESGIKLRSEADIAMMPQYVPGGQWGTDSSWRVYLQSMGGNVFSEDNKLIEDNELAVKALQWIYDQKFVNKITYDTQFWTPEMYSAMVDDQFATWPINGGSQVLIEKGAPDLAGKWSRAPWPIWEETGNKYNAEMGSSGIAVPDQGEHPDEAFEFAKYYALTEEGQKALWEYGKQIPSYTPALESEEVFDKTSDYYSGSTLRDFLGGRETPVFRYYAWAEVPVILGDQIDLMMADEQSPEATWAACVKNLKDAGIGV